MKSVFLCFICVCFLSVNVGYAGETDWTKALAEGYHELAAGNTDHAAAIFLKR